MTTASARAATAADVARICAVCATGYRAAHRDLLPADHVERAVRDYYQPERVRREIDPDPPGWFGYQVVEEAGRVLGAAAGGLTAPGVGHLFVIYLDPAERNRGLGTVLLDHVTGQLRTAGATELWVTVTEGNQRGIPFYEARGFRLVDRQPASDTDDGLGNLRMRKPLTTLSPG